MSGLSIRASFKGGVVVISVLNGSTTLAFLGASCPASALPGNEGLSSVTLSPNKGEEAVVALTTFTRYGGKNPDIMEGGLVRLHWEGDKLVVDTDKPFISLADRLGQVVPGGKILQVTTRGQTFATLSTIREVEKGVRLVDDANLLCRYLVGQATFEEVKVVASGDHRSAEMIQIQELRAKLSRVTEDYRNAQKLAQDEINKWTQMYEGVEGRVILLQKQLDATFGAKWKRFWERVSIYLQFISR